MWLMAALSKDVGFAGRAPEPRFEKIKVAGFVRLRSRSQKDVAVPSLKATDQRLRRFFNDAAQEALHRLEQDGLIATFRQSRSVVTHIDPEQLRCEHFLRTAIECKFASQSGV